MDKIDLSLRVPEKERIPVPQSVRTKLFMRCKGRCEECGDSLESITPHIHHKDGNPRNNKLTNLQVLCPNCHSTAHEKLKPKPKNTRFTLL